MKINPRLIFFLVFFSIFLFLLSRTQCHGEDLLPPIQNNLLEMKRWNATDCLAPAPINPAYGEEVDWIFHEPREIGGRTFLISYGKNKQGEPRMDLKEVTPFWTRVKLWWNGDGI